MAPLVPVAEEWLEVTLGAPVQLEGVRIQSTPRSVDLRFDQLSSEGARSFKAKDGRVALTLGRLFNLQPIPRLIEVREITGQVVHEPAMGATSQGVSIERVLAALAGGRAGDLILPKVTVRYLDETGAELFELKDAELLAEMRGDGYGIEAALPFVLADGSAVSADLEVSIAEDGSAFLSFLSDGAPIQPLLSAFGVDAFRLESAVKGEVALAVDGAGQPQGGLIDIALSPGAGRIGTSDFSLGENQLRATFAQGEPVFHIDQLTYDVAGNRGNLSGQVGTQNLFDPVNLMLDFDVRGTDILVDLKSFMDAPIPVADVRAEGSFDAAQRRLALSELRSEFFGSELSGFLALTFPEGFAGSPRIESDATLPGPLTPKQVLAGWPRPLAREARAWVVQNLRDGQLTDLTYSSDIPMGAIREGAGLPDETMEFTFRADQGRVRYLPDMPPVTALSATAVVRGNSFSVRGERGFVRGVEVTDALLSMPNFRPAGSKATFTGKLRGDVSTVLKALEASGLVDFSEGAYTTDSFHGEGSFDLEVSWPLQENIPEDAVFVGGEGAFVSGGIDDVVPGIDATDATGLVSLTPDRVLIRGDGLAAQASTVFEWRQELRGQQRAQLAVTTELDAMAADMVGVPLRQFFRGQIETQIYADDLRPGQPLRIQGNLDRAAVSIPALGVRKPRGVEGSFETSVALPEMQPPGSPPPNITLTELLLTSPSFDIEGSGTFTPEGGVIRLELPRLFIEDTADLSLRLLTSETGIDLHVEGAHASAVTAIDGFFEADGGSGKGTLPGSADVDLNLRRVSLKNGVELYDVTATGHHTGTYVEELILGARLGAEDVVSLTVDQPGGSELGFVEVEATAFGTLLNGIFGLSSISGAPGSIKGSLLPDDRFEGRFEMGQLIVRDAPILARLLSFTSLEGLADALAGEGIRFSRLEGDVMLDGGLVTLADAKLVGSSLGLSAAGYVDLDEGTLDIRGAFAPVYALNGFLGSIPGLGRLFISREGEGIVAFSYSITGSLDQPVVTVNALSVLTPGILRRIFDPVPDGGEALDRATDQATDQTTGQAESENELFDVP